MLSPLPGDAVVTLVLHSEKGGLGSAPDSGAIVCGVCTFYPCSASVPSGYSGFSSLKLKIHTHTVSTAMGQNIPLLKDYLHITGSHHLML